jgi:hypothetical protein
MHSKFYMFATLLISFCSHSYAQVTSDFFGVINVGIKSADRLTQSYGKDVLVAPTEAGRESGNIRDTYRRTSLQSAQSKFGWNFKANDKINGVLELDMVDFDKGTPTTHALRVRKASFQYLINEDSRLRVGKDFTIFNAVGPHTSNWVGGSYRAGNTGFILDEMVYFRQLGSMEIALALGNMGRNNGQSDTLTEIPTDFSFPSTSLRIENKTSFGRYGFAYTGNSGTQWNKKDVTFTNTQSWAQKVYADFKFDTTNLRFSAYQGVNTNDMALLGLASSRQGTLFVNLKESGAFVSLNYDFANSSSLYGGLSQAQINNPSDGLSTNALSKNQTARLGYKQLLDTGFSAFFELTHFKSEYNNVQGSADTTLAQSNLAHVGFLLSF